MNSDTSPSTPPSSQPILDTPPSASSFAIQSPRHFRSIRFILLALIVLLSALLYLLHSQSWRYTVTPQLTSKVSFLEFFKKDSQPTLIKTITYKNDFITPRKITLPDVLTCAVDKDAAKKNIELTSSKQINSSSYFVGYNYTTTETNQTLWLPPFSTLQVQYFANGDWYDYVYQYQDYDQINLLPIHIGLSAMNPNCETSSNIESVPLTLDTCIGCVDTISGGPDIAIIDFISNDDTIWENGYISFIPIIKNIGSESTGPFTVSYSLNGRPSTSFELPNLESGEIINNFIAGSGFKGNFLPRDIKPEMELQIEISLSQAQDVNLQNNHYAWKFHYTTSPQPKHSCTYSDINQSTEDFYSATAITYGDKTFSDFCVDDTYLMEYSCDEHSVYEGDDNLDVFLYICPNGCRQGSCVGNFADTLTPTPTKSSMVDANTLPLKFGPPDSTISSSHTAVVYNDKMYVYGGYNLKDKNLKTLRIYDFKTQTWSQGPTDSAGAGYAGHTAVIYKDKMYIYTGNILRIFDLLTQTWSEGITNGLDTYGRFNHTAVIYKDKMYIYGGGQSNWARNLYIYSFDSQRWDLGVSSPSTLQMHTAHSAVEHNGKMYVFGGNPLNGKQDQTNTMLVYDFEQQSWSEGAADDQTQGRYEHTANVFNNKMYVYGGVSGDVSGFLSNTVRVYDLINQTWSELGKIRNEFKARAHSSIVYDGQLYIFGGEKQYYGRDITNQLIIMDLTP